MFQRMDLDKNDRIEWHEWRAFLVLYPSAHVKDVLRFWHRTAMQLSFLDDYSLPDGVQEVARHEWWRHMVAGGAAGAVSRTVTAPLDRMKIMFQIQAVGQQASMADTLRSMLHEGKLGFGP